MAEPRNSQGYEFSLLIIIVFTVIVAECIIGVIVNGFILVVNAAAWLQKKAISICSRILFFLSISRIGLQSFIMLEIILFSKFQVSYYKSVFYIIFKVSFIFVNYCSLWLGALLSFFYFVKIANFSYPLFLKLKWRISGLMHWLLWFSAFISFSSSMLFCKDTYTTHNNNSLTINFHNFTRKIYLIRTNVINVAWFFSLGTILPLVMFITTAILLIFSLNRHTMHMRSRATGLRDPSVEAHARAIKETSYFLTFYIFNAIALFLSMSNIFQGSVVWNLFLRVIITSYPVGHSILLIQNNPGIRRTWKQLQSQIYRRPKSESKVSS